MNKKIITFVEILKRKSMDIFNLIVGILVGSIATFYIKELSYLLKITFSFCSAFLLLKLFHPNLYLLGIYDWSWQNLFNGNNFWVEGISWCLLSYFVFYWCLPKLLMATLIKVMEAKYFKFYNELNLYELKKIKLWFICAIKFYTKIAFKIIWRAMDESNYKEYDKTIFFSYSNYINNLVLIFSFSLHFILSWIAIFGFNKNIFIPVLLIIFMILLFILYVPSLKTLSYFISKYFTHEFNRNLKQVLNRA